MPKMKTKSAAKKRFKVTASGKVKRAHSGKNHILTKKDRKRKKYHDSHCNSKWSDSHTYDLSLNSSTLGVEGSVEFLSSYIDKRISKMK